jgi:hypothetical protein
MSDIPLGLRSQVADRAHHRCEYCELAQAGQEATFHIDHITPRVAGGSTTHENLALACVSCSLRKAAKQVGIDPQSGEEVVLFNPRRQTWSEHFRWEREFVVALTATGRATIRALSLNRSLIVAIRKEEALHGRHPPPVIKTDAGF